MLALRNTTQFQAMGTILLDPQGREHWTVVVRGTFTLRDKERPEPSEKQEPVQLSPEYYGEPGKSSLRFDGEMLFDKPFTDILLNGTAYAPGGDPTTSSELRIVVGRNGTIDKRICVTGDRRWKRSFSGVAASSPEPFTAIPLRYERAFGGYDPTIGDAQPGAGDDRNPIGTGFARGASHLVDTLLPNFESPDALIAKWDDRPPPAGAGAIAPSWLPRRACIGNCDAKWRRERMPLPPADFDLRFNQCAPTDQQVERTLRGGEPIELMGLTPSGELKSELPRVYLGFRTRVAGRWTNHAGRLDTIILEPDEQRMFLVWRTALPAPRDRLTIEETIIFEKEIV